jgi:hypothetical protein
MRTFAEGFTRAERDWLDYQLYSSEADITAGDAVRWCFVFVCSAQQDKRQRPNACDALAQERRIEERLNVCIEQLYPLAAEMISVLEAEVRGRA